MKLIEIRFGNLSPTEWQAIANQFAKLFQDLGEFDLSAVSVAGIGHTESDLRKISVGELPYVLNRSFSASWQIEDRAFADIVTIRSNRSRRFIVTEDDGLVRICLAAEDPLPDFSSFGAFANDASHLLITTDLFDYI